jgi:Protein of unknown function (DUF1353)
LKFTVLVSVIVLTGCATEVRKPDAMIGFSTQAKMIELSRGEIAKRELPDVWYGEFLEDLICTSAIAGTFSIPKGFVSDGATIPPVLWNILSDTSPDILYPSFAHDLLYSVHGKLPGIWLTRDKCDNVIREQMKALGAPAWKYDSVYRALHLFGGIAWGHHTLPQKLEKTFYAHNLEAVSRP